MPHLTKSRCSRWHLWLLPTHLYWLSTTNTNGKTSSRVSRKTNPTSSNLNNPTPLWLMLAIALSCASGCLVIYLLLKLPLRL
ncbi:hypothetical protein [Trichormus azollae]|uniref:hypothetical protein n=1 Tax=Trichormus azollae TaxID=1164 RepID=UPI00325C8A9C